MAGALQWIVRLQTAPVPPVPPCKDLGEPLEAAQLLPVPRVPPVPSQTLEFLNQYVGTAQEIDWLTQLASLLECSPEYLLERGFLDRHDLAEQHQQEPWRIARLIRSHPNWHQPLDRYAHVHEGESEVSKGAVSKQVSMETTEFRDQYARAREGDTADTPASLAWTAVRDAFHAHALGACLDCYPPLGRYCAIGADLRASYMEVSLVE